MIPKTLRRIFSREPENRDINFARTYSESIEVIPKAKCDEGMQALVDHFQKKFPEKDSVVVMPVLRGGKVVGDDLANKGRAPKKNIRASYYDPKGLRRKQPEILRRPKIRATDIIVNNLYCKDIVLCEAVAETGETIAAIKAYILGLIDAYCKLHGLVLNPPRFFVYALIDKTSKQERPDNMIAAFRMGKGIWVAGRGCDYKGKGRRKKEIVGMMSPFWDGGRINPPYYEQCFPFQQEVLR